MHVDLYLSNFDNRQLGLTNIAKKLIEKKLMWMINCLTSTNLLRIWNILMIK